jgi:hypothetical protein
LEREDACFQVYPHPYDIYMPPDARDSQVLW